MHSFVEVGECLIDYSNKHGGKPVRLFMTPKGDALFLLPGEHTKHIFWSSWIGTYNGSCPALWIAQDLSHHMAAKRNKEIV